MKRHVITIGSAVLAAGAITAAAIGFGGNNRNSAAQTTATVPATVPVMKSNLTQTQTVSGVLGYGAVTTADAHGPGTITWLPVLGATVDRGQALYKVDNHPVSLLFGTLPLYRPLRTGDSGDDVREIEENLAAMGYAGFAVDRSFTETTATAVKKWQKDLGLTQTGIIEPGTIVIAPAAVRVTVLTAKPGGQADGDVLGYAGTVRVVSIALDVALQGLAKTGLAAQVILPDGKAVNGTITTVGTVATPGADEHHPATIEVTVAVADQSTLGTLDAAPVNVKLAAQTVENVLTLPVMALVALAEGGYGIQLADGRYVAVQPGMFANGRVQITGSGVTEGMLVVVPS